MIVTFLFSCALLFTQNSIECMINSPHYPRICDQLDPFLIFSLLWYLSTNATIRTRKLDIPNDPKCSKMHGLAVLLNCRSDTHIVMYIIIFTCDENHVLHKSIIPRPLLVEIEKLTVTLLQRQLY